MDQRIIVGVDGSGPGRAALAWALVHCSRTAHGELVLHHVVDDEWGQMGGDYARSETAAGEVILQDALAQCTGVGARTVLSHGSIVGELVGGARGGDLIVVGTHKTGYVRGRVLGTRSIAVASLAPCTVVVVPEENLSQRHGVVVGVAPGSQSHAAVIAAAAAAHRMHEELFLLHATTGPADAGPELLAQAAALAMTTAPGITIRRRTSQRRPSEALLDASRGAGLLVLGTSRTDPGRAGFIGSVAHEVLLNLNAPVMVAR